ncbi:hypothetical protein COCNU_07G002210 [Cocos nucifera]|uniref:Uncharacterized protein n=1 Tax=Cocos nucifera TaxID=13894 RepID=A0A8K0N4V9_COCNU|nr:hypothetical protein [Cocos nucifera]KAG1354109.1 hypothetical protein COCNU_07G002210 [Cocos nucifera]
MRGAETGGSAKHRKTGNLLPALKAESNVHGSCLEGLLEVRQGPRFQSAEEDVEQGRSRSR